MFLESVQATRIFWGHSFEVVVIDNNCGPTLGGNISLCSVLDIQAYDAASPTNAEPIDMAFFVEKIESCQIRGLFE